MNYVVASLLLGRIPEQYTDIDHCTPLTAESEEGMHYHYIFVVFGCALVDECALFFSNVHSHVLFVKSVTTTYLVYKMKHIVHHPYNSFRRDSGRRVHSGSGSGTFFRNEWIRSGRQCRACGDLGQQQYVRYNKK